MDAGSHDADLLEKISSIMKETLNESLADFKKRLSKEILGITKTNEESIAKLKKGMNTKLKSFEEQVIHNQKSTLEKIPQMEQAINRINEVISDDTYNKIKRLDEVTPMLDQLATKVEGQQWGYDEKEKSLEYNIKDIATNKCWDSHVHEQL